MHLPTTHDNRQLVGDWILCFDSLMQRASSKGWARILVDAVGSRLAIVLDQNLEIGM
jgi:hypothetical protein